MIDAKLRPLIDKPLNKIARLFISYGATANGITLFNVGLAVFIIIILTMGLYKAALIFILINRLLDGIDGAVARQSGGGTDFGGFLDIVTDFILYGGVLVGFAAADHAHALAASFLLFSYLANGTSFLAFAAIAAKQNLETEHQGKKAFYYLGGLAEGFETIVVMVLMCLFPLAFSVFAILFGSLCFASMVGRCIMAHKSFS